MGPLETLTDQLMNRYRTALGFEIGTPLAFEMLLGSRTPDTIVVGENPGGAEVPHMTGSACISYGTQFFQSAGHHEQWASVWRRYAWMLPGNPFADPEQFGWEASVHLMVTNCWHGFGKPVPRVLRRLKGVGVQLLIQEMALKNITIVAQGGPAWDWVRKVTKPLAPVNPTKHGLEALWGKPGYRKYDGPKKYKATWNGDSAWPIYILPVAHLSGRYNFQRIPHVLELQSEYRDEWERPL